MANLKADTREKLGSRSSRKLRAAGRIPVCIQGGDKGNVNASIEEHAFLAARRHHEHLFDLELAGTGAETAVVRELQYDSFGDRITHVEFRRVVRGQKIDSEIELAFIGHPKGGVLNHLVTHITISCLPSDIPDSIEVKVEALTPESPPLLAKDIPLPAGMTLVEEPETPIAVVVVPRAEAEVEEEEEAAAEPAAPGAAKPPGDEGTED